MTTKQAELVLRLIDQVTGPAKAVTATLGGLNRAVAGMGASWSRSANGMLGLSAPIGLAGTALASDVLTWEKSITDLNAVIDMTDAQLARLKAQSDDYIALGVGQSEYVEAATAFAKSGLGFDATLGVTGNALALSRAGDIGAEDAAKSITAIASSYQAVMDTLDQADTVSREIADRLAFAADRSVADIPAINLSMSYSAPLAGALGIELDTLTAMNIALANAGFSGERAGTGLRGIMVSLVDPTKEAVDALAGMNIQLSDYVRTGQRIEAGPLLELLADEGFDARGTGITAGLQRQLDNAALRADPAQMRDVIGALIAGAVSEGLDNEQRSQLSGVLEQQLALLASDVDVVGVFNALGRTPGAEAFLGQIFGREAVGQAIALSKANLRAGIDDVARNADGYAARTAEKRMAGITGLLQELTAGVERFAIILSDSGLLGDAMRGISGAIEGLAQLGEVSPGILRLGGAAAFALTGLAPLGWALSGIASAAAFVINPITLIGAALGALAVLNWDKILGFFDGFGEAFRVYFNPQTLVPVTQAIDALKEAFGSLGAGIGFKGIGEDFGRMTAQFINDMPEFVAQLAGMRTQLQPVFDWFVPVIESAGRVLAELKNEFVSFTVASFEGITSGIANFQATLKPETVDTIIKWGAALRDFATSSDAAWQANAQATSQGQASWWETELGKLGGDFAASLNTTARELEAIAAFFDQLPGKVTAAFESVKATLASINLFDAGVALMATLGSGIASTAQMLADAARGAVAGIPGAIMGALAPPSAAGFTPGVNPNNSVGPNVAPTGLPVPNFAKGGSYEPGLIVTGEKGAELQMASGRGQVFNAKDTRDMLSGKGQQGMTINNTFQITGSNAKEMAGEISRIIDTQLQRSRSLAMDDRYVGE